MNVAVREAALPPMLVQYLEYKSRHSDCLLFFQVGDFYELFFEDAVTASRALNLTLTSRDKNSPNPIPMAGVPVANVEAYISRLVALSYSVAIVSQEQKDPNSRGMLERKLERIITPGISLLGNLEDGAAARVVAALYIPAAFDQGAEVALAYSDVQSGKLFVREGLSLENVAAEVARCMPAELILPSAVEAQRFDRRNFFVKELELQLGQSGVKFRPERYLTEDPGSLVLSGIEGFSTLGSSSRKASRLLLNYIAEVTVGLALPIYKAELASYQSTLSIDAVTRRTLELIRNARDGSSRATLIEYLDCAVSPGGKRLLREWLLAPLSDTQAINARLDAVEELKLNFELRATVRKSLDSICDIDRVCARIELGVVTPRELGALRDCCQALPELEQQLLAHKVKAAELIEGVLSKLKIDSQLATRLSQLSDNPPFSLQDGGVFASGVSAELDQLRSVRSQGKNWILELEQAEREATGINSLKIKHNNQLGYFFEVTQTNISKVPEHFVRKQGTANFERFTSPELKSREAQVFSAESRGLDIERSLYLELREQIKQFSPVLREIGGALSRLDLFACLAELAERDDLKRPELSSGTELLIKDGFHPVVAKLLKGSFVRNSLDLSDIPCAVLTGPNMGGKSTYLRQTGLIVIMAQLGSFVPAKQARIGVVDRVFARMGAADDLAEGDSTFMLEMRETAQILRNATERSLLLVDEIGRGTATADGLAIAKAVLEWVAAKLAARTLFATHFHELTRVSSNLSTVQNLSVAAVEIQGRVVFTHQIKRGAASKSYGVEVAELAGLPAEILTRARQLLNDESALESEQAHDPSRQLSMFAFQQARAQIEPSDYQDLKRMRQLLTDFEIDRVTPLEALNFLATLKS